jgi:hypothetical protein
MNLKDNNVKNSVCFCGNEKDPYSKTCIKCVDLSGSKNPNWKGEFSKTAINKLIRTNPIYKSWVKSVMQRNNYTCQFTGQRGGELEVHHRPKELHELIDEAKELFTDKTKIIKYVLEKHKDLSIGITVSRKYHKTVIHKDSYNFKYKERQTYPQAKAVVAINYLTGEIREFVSGGKAAKNLGIQQQTVNSILKNKSKKKSGWTFLLKNEATEQDIKNKIEIAKSRRRPNVLS